MTIPRALDAVDAILEQWQNERPDLNTLPMGTIGRLKRASMLIERRLKDCFSEFGLTSWEFDVLATLRRSGTPYRLAPTALFSALMVTSGTMTHRLQSLENRCYVRRIANPEDARSLMVELTTEGFDLIDRAVTAHVANEHRILANLTEEDLVELDCLLSRLLGLLDE